MAGRKTFAAKVLGFYEDLKLNTPLPDGVQVMNPYTDASCFAACRAFYEKFYSDHKSRFLILGINPGRHGAGITGIPFTDPVKLETLFGIKTALPRKAELSAEFIHAMITAFGGHERFFSRFFINSVSPLGFVHAGKNINYYDTPRLREALGPFIRKCMRSVVDLGVRREIVYCLGEGENYRYLTAMNTTEKWFGEVIPLAHPRFIMQYKRKQIPFYIKDYLEKLGWISKLKE